MSNFIYKLVAFILVLLLMPFFLLLFLLVKLDSKGSFLFTQKRPGKDKKLFTIYKIRTMVHNADNLKFKYLHLNEYKPPIFKIQNDPRYTKVGKFLANHSLDEFPQLINVIMGHMSLVGPRPLPISEADKIPLKYQKRFSVLPGMIPPWFAIGSHTLTSDKWLDLDIQYVKKKSFMHDLDIISSGIKKLILKN